VTAVFPTPAEATPSLTAASAYIRGTLNAIGAAEGSQQKRLAKGKSTTYDPKSDKKLTIFVATSGPEWQQKYIDLVRDSLEEGVAGLTIDTKKVLPKVDKKDMKKAMPFVQLLKRRIDGGEAADSVFERKLGFEEEYVLGEMVPGLKVTVTKLKVVEIVVVKGQDGLPASAAQAEPGSPTFEFVNV
jgi:leucyl-tRNA synthetase